MIDDDRSLRTAIRELIESVAKPSGQGRSFSKQNCQVPSYVVLDMGLPGLSGFNLQRELTETYHSGDERNAAKLCVRA